jgi:hypothetical protein
MTNFDWSKLEPEAKVDDDTFDSNLSIAISLKRIADKLEVGSKQPIIMNAEEYNRYVKAREMYDTGVAAMRKSATP